MKKSNIISIVLVLSTSVAFGLVGPVVALAAGLAPVDLLSTGDFAILSKTGITDTGSHTSVITGNIGSSPITAAAISDVFCSEVVGTIYGVDAAYVGSGTQTCFAGNPPLSNKTLVDNAVLDMGTVYADAAERTSPTATELGAGDIGGMTLAPGLYKWSTDVSIPTNVTLSGGANDVWIFQIAGNLNIASGGSSAAGVKVLLAGGAQASNVFWQVGGVSGATLGTYSTFNGNIVSAKEIAIQTGATLNGRALARTQVTLDADTVSLPTPPPSLPASVTMTVDAYVDGVPATATNTSNADFSMVSTTTTSNLNGGVASTSTYELNSDDSYQTVTSNMASGANYATNEIAGGLVVGADCASNQPFSLVGYTSGVTLADAAAATPTGTLPSFNSLTQDRFVIVWNQDCSKPTGALAVTSINPVTTSAIADGLFAHGWKYVFRITVPTDETNLAMKFADWLNASTSGTIPAASNMRISSAQADNASATVLISAANTYSSPSLHITGDLDPTTPGDQIEVTVETAVPSNTVNGSYSTSYGVQTLP